MANAILQCKVEGQISGRRPARQWLDDGKGMTRLRLEEMAMGHEYGVTWRMRASRVAPNDLNSLWDSRFKKIETCYCRYISIHRYLQYDVDLFDISVDLETHPIVI